MPRRAVIHADATVEGGFGHLMRALAVGQEATGRGWTVEIVGDILDDARERVDSMAPEVAIRSFKKNQATDFLSAAAHTHDVVHIDSYDAVPDITGDRALVSNMQDGPYGVRTADLAIDANLGAEGWFDSSARSAHRLIGVDAAVIRSQVRRQRDVPVVAGDRPRLLVVMGGTDPQRLTGRILEGLARIEAPLEVTVVAAADRHDELRNVIDDAVHIVDFHPFVSDLPALARQQTLVITAAGTSVWDFACLGTPMALVCAVDNQRRGYDAAVGGGLGTGLGVPPHTALVDRVAGLAELVVDRARLDAQAAHAAALVDGLGVWRIVSAWEQLLEKPVGTGAPGACAVRRATMADARTLFDWRNDETTRQNSRSSGVLVWEDHLAWLARCLADSERRLLVVSQGSYDIGTVRWDRHADHDWEISIALAPQSRGRGLGAAALAAGEKALDVDAPLRMLAGIHSDNGASRRLFERAGYLPHLPADGNGFEMRAKWRLPDDSE
ncbi:bifunctional UDP-2,4-diacetamido-2,4,6-trideoxy-beta-L-altropyranose hydrolase/GNAT family N-acetyltransferase [Microbacterium sp. AK031]|uniref:bifunctional UDP-2,4-diacetamido-2,4,6-trideoxy-beta-L-altropyranose hydrolase/GNAT family N-acetyltransferase n=1 Tax=Microbacterium sp. AK031 TaxID=2723076 RepID=UPI0021680B08|nr:bifunctional UDP-2,4-diacetamido-2,4,6-trideoxy-beta-L-altropyranose hydrolase/GNAT family N-acetyltransferase [Microbacterium sp. AK031]MCS3841747.1 spore coat polysaccharide biosynthesis predicted glycosyltransferase SpsG/GNAT superfamily N-acetyltransferase [Microbacterium sp. AK031]